MEAVVCKFASGVSAVRRLLIRLFNNLRIGPEGQVTSVLAGAFAAILLTGTTNNSLEIAGMSFYLPVDIRPWKIYEIFFLDSITYILVIFVFMIMKYSLIFHLTFAAEAGRITKKRIVKILHRKLKILIRSKI